MRERLNLRLETRVVSTVVIRDIVMEFAISLGVTINMSACYHLAIALIA